MKTKFDSITPGKDRYGEDIKQDRDGLNEYPDDAVFTGLNETAKTSVFGRSFRVEQYSYRRIENNCYVVGVAGMTIGVPSSGTAVRNSGPTEIELYLFESR